MILSYQLKDGTLQIYDSEYYGEVNSPSDWCRQVLQSDQSLPIKEIPVTHAFV